MSRKHARNIELARAVALSTEGVGARNSFRLGAVVVWKNTIVSSGGNSRKSNPNAARPSRYMKKSGNQETIYCLHAEMSALIRAGMDRCNGATIYVARVNREGHLMMAKPCEMCHKMIAAYGIKRVVYTISEEQHGEYRVGGEE